MNDVVLLPIVVLGMLALRTRRIGGPARSAATPWGSSCSGPLLGAVVG